MSFLKDCVNIAPTYLSLGNHEQKPDREDIKEIENAGVVVLDNFWIEIPEKRILVGGLGEYCTSAEAV